MIRHRAATTGSLASLSGRLEGFRAALGCVEDYVCMHGSKMWHEELSRIVNYNVEQEMSAPLLVRRIGANRAPII